MGKAFLGPAEILAKANPSWTSAAISRGSTQKSIDALNWGTFVSSNLIPVTLGNIVGGALFVGMAYWFIYLYRGKA